MTDGADHPDAVDDIQQAWKRERPDLPVESIGIITRIWRIGRLLESRRRALLREMGTDSSTLDLLSTLRRAGPPHALTPGQIAERTLITTGGVSQRLDRAESAGLIHRNVAPADSRSVVVTLTDSGNELVDRVVGRLLAVEQEYVNILSPGDRRALAHLLRRFLQTLQS